jgi:PPK2 family polyphosphate:nucleotide phosphotransferase
MSKHDYFKQFKVKRHKGRRMKLRDFDADDRGSGITRESAEHATKKNIERIDELQYLLYSEKKHSVLIVLQGLDGAGKDSVIRRVLSMNPAGCQVTSFKQPTAQELEHDFLWRVHPHAPAVGRVAIFNRSHYEDVLITRVHGRVSKKTCARRYETINEFERLLRLENNTTILKFFLHITKDEQLRRFRKRLLDPARNWKISDADYRERDYWDDYTRAYEDVLSHTSLEEAPWFVIPSDHKWFRDLAISQIVVRALEDLGMKRPKPQVDLAEIQRKYHQAAAEAKHGDSRSEKSR